MLGTGAATGPLVVVDAGGNAFAFWLAKAATGDQRWSARYLATDGWQLAARRALSTKGVAAGQASASVDDVGRVHAAWVDGSTIRGADCE